MSLTALTFLVSLLLPSAVLAEDAAQPNAGPEEALVCLKTDPFDRPKGLLLGWGYDPRHPDKLDGKTSPWETKDVAAARDWKTAPSFRIKNAVELETAAAAETVGLNVLAEANATFGLSTVSAALAHSNRSRAESSQASVRWVLQAEKQDGYYYLSAKSPELQNYDKELDRTEFWTKYGTHWVWKEYVGRAAHIVFTFKAHSNVSRSELMTQVSAAFDTTGAGASTTVTYTSTEFFSQNSVTVSMDVVTWGGELVPDFAVDLPQSVEQVPKMFAEARNWFTNWAESGQPAPLCVVTQSYQTIDVNLGKDSIDLDREARIRELFVDFRAAADVIRRAKGIDRYRTLTTDQRDALRKLWTLHEDYLSVMLARIRARPIDALPSSSTLRKIKKIYDVAALKRIVPCLTSEPGSVTVPFDNQIKWFGRRRDEMPLRLLFSALYVRNFPETDKVHKRMIGEELGYKVRLTVKNSTASVLIPRDAPAKIDFVTARRNSVILDLPIEASDLETLIVHIGGEKDGRKGQQSLTLERDRILAELNARNGRWEFSDDKDAGIYSRTRGDWKTKPHFNVILETGGTDWLTTHFALELKEPSQTVPGCPK